MYKLGASVVPGPGGRGDGGGGHTAVTALLFFLEDYRMQQIWKRSLNFTFLLLVLLVLLVGVTPGRCTSTPY